MAVFGPMTKALDSDLGFRVGPWKVEPSLNRILAGDRTISLEPKVMRVLVVLAENAGRLTSRGELMERVWENAHMGDDPTTRAISELRRILGDDPQSPSYIETIHGKGYRLIAAVESADPREEGAPAPAARGRRWIPVLAGVAALLLALVLVFWIDSERDAEQAPGLEVARRVPLTAFPGRELQPALSPDGTRVAFAWAGGGSGLDLWVKQHNTEQPLRLTETPESENSAVWSPDGTEIAFVRSSPEGCEIRAVPAIGGPERLLFRCRGPVVGLDWSPDGRELALAQPREEASVQGLVLVNLEDGSSSTLEASAGVRGGDSLPRFSPDGRRVAFRRTEGAGTHDVYLLDRPTGETRRLTFDRQDVGGLDFSRDGKSLVVSSNRSGIFGLWRISLGTDPPLWLGLENAYLPSVASRAGALAFEQRGYDLDLWRIPFSDPGGEATRWASSTRFDLDPRYSPDGSRVAFVSQRSGSHELWVADADGLQPRQLTFFGEPAPAWAPGVQHPRWSADGSSLVFAARADGDFDVFTVRADGGTPRPLTSSIVDDLSPAWGRDGKVYFMTRREEGWEIWRVDTEGEGAERVWGENVLPALETASDGSLLFARDGSELWRLEEGGGRPERVASDVRFANWAATDQGILFLAGGNLARLAPQAEQAVLTPLAGSLFPAGGLAVVASGLALSPDERWLLYSAVDSVESDLILVEGRF